MVDEYTIRSYSEGDEEEILPLFNQAFSQKRSMEHWLWKFRDSPFGRYKIKLCCHGKRLVAQYAGYPVRMELYGKEINVLHLGDSMTHPDYRSNVMGRRGLLVGTANDFFDEFGGQESDKAQIMYGFNTGRVQKLGRLLLKYTPVCKVTQLGKVLERKKGKGPSSINNFLYAFQFALTVPQDIDTLWKNCRSDKGLESVRDYEYLKWRYEDCPDTEYTFWTLRNRFTKVIQGVVITREKYIEPKNLMRLFNFKGKYSNQDLSKIYEKVANLGKDYDYLASHALCDYVFINKLLKKSLALNRHNSIALINLAVTEAYIGGKEKAKSSLCEALLSTNNLSCKILIILNLFLLKLGRNKKSFLI